MNSKKNAASNWKVYCIIDNTFRGAQNPEKAAGRLFASGVDAVQVRYKNQPAYELAALAKRLRGPARRYGKTLLVNDRVDTSLAAGLDAVHIGSGDIRFDLARRLLGEKSLIGKTAHSKKDAGIARREKADYISAGPIFATPVKRGLRPKGTRFIKIVKSTAGKTPVFAIGGITLKNFKEALQNGADGICVTRAAKSAERLVKEIK